MIKGRWSYLKELNPCQGRKWLPKSVCVGGGQVVMQVVMRRGFATDDTFYSAKKWRGNCPPCRALPPFHLRPCPAYKYLLAFISIILFFYQNITDFLRNFSLQNSQRGPFGKNKYGARWSTCFLKSHFWSFRVLIWFLLIV